MTTVVDASVAVRWFVHESGHAQALALLDHQDDLFAPDCIVPEVVGAVWERIRNGRICGDHGSAIVAAITSGVPSLLPVAEFAEEALRHTAKMDRFPHLAFYLSAAESLNADFVSADEAVVRIACEVFDPERIRLLSD
jgi:predicted nucleic acid-binding protein